MHGFESKLLNTLKTLNLPSGSMAPVVCVSGGKDSVALLRSLIQIKGALNLKPVNVLYIHHGYSDSDEQNDYRDRAETFVIDFCKAWELNYLPTPLKPSKYLISEEQFRDFRVQCFQKLLMQNSNYCFWLAQHQDDQLETRLIRLIRGTGPEGLQAMKMVDYPYIRPLLGFSEEEISGYLTDIQQDWLEDPSNSTNDYFRNWIRNHWLADLEAYRPGSVKRLSESLSQIVESYKSLDQSVFTDAGLDRLKFRGLSRAEQKQVLAQFCIRKGIRNYTQGQFNELLKHLDRDEKVFTLELMKSSWSVDAKHINVLFKKQD